MAKTQAQPAAQPGPVIVRREQVGQRIDGVIGPGNLNPGAGYACRRTGQPIFCGAIIGHVMGYQEHPNKLDEKRTSRRFAGDFLAIPAAGGQRHAAEAYLPSSVERAVKAALDIGHGPVAIAIDVWVEPDEEARPTPIGYRYVSYSRKPRAESDPLLSLAYSAGLLEPPRESLPAPSETAVAQDGTQYDPESGEVVE